MPSINLTKTFHMMPGVSPSIIFITAMTELQRTEEATYTDTRRSPFPQNDLDY